LEDNCAERVAAFLDQWRWRRDKPQMTQISQITDGKFRADDGKKFFRNKEVVAKTLTLPPIIRVICAICGFVFGPEGPPFHDCGMHYIDLARWYAQSEIERWDAMGLRIWNWSEPWWGTAHGHFQNGVVFKVTVGFTYGQLAQRPVTHCALEAIGTLGVVRMQHDFNEVVIRTL
jgi:hypothetical protein